MPRRSSARDKRAERLEQTTRAALAARVKAIQTERIASRAFAMTQAGGYLSGNSIAGFNESAALEDTRASRAGRDRQRMEEIENLNAMEARLLLIRRQNGIDLEG